MSYVGVNDYLRLHGLPLTCRMAFLRYAETYGLECIEYNGRKFFNIKDLDFYFSKIHKPAPRPSRAITPYDVMAFNDIDLQKINDICKRFGFTSSYSLDDALPLRVVKYLKQQGFKICKFD